MISGTFYGGFPREVLEAVADKTLNAYATAEIVEDYSEIVQEMIARKQGHLTLAVLNQFVHHLHLAEPVTSVKVSRDPDDDKFIECAIDSKSYYIVSGDKDLLILEKYKDIEIITAAEFCNRFLQ